MQPVAETAEYRRDSARTGDQYLPPENPASPESQASRHSRAAQAHPMEGERERLTLPANIQRSDSTPCEQA